MQRDGIPHAPLATDQEFLRRVMLDLTGRIPTPSEVREFLADKAPDKRARLIDQLIGSPGFRGQVVVLLSRPGARQRQDAARRRAVPSMVKDSLAADRPYDDFARSLIAPPPKATTSWPRSIRSSASMSKARPASRRTTATISTRSTRPTRTTKSPSCSARVFLGINLSCIGCHDGGGHLEKVNVYLSQQKARRLLPAVGILRQYALHPVDRRHRVPHGAHHGRRSGQGLQHQRREHAAHEAHRRPEHAEVHSDR